MADPLTAIFEQIKKYNYKIGGINEKEQGK